MKLSYGVKLGYFFWSLALGGILCLIYDGIRCGRRLTKPSIFRINLEDGLFFLLSGILLFLAAFDKNGGRIRWQGFLGTILGMAGYHLLFRDWIVRIGVSITETFLRIIVWIVRTISIPVQFVYRLLAKPFYVVAWYSRKSLSKTERILKVKRKKRQLKKKREHFTKQRQKS
ncbi:MAG: spore cortex biosynthesis protein YabQ [Clostridia bacterium]|nr:spore cortex biosynthesis protein YabQ [Clostridia bacterium]